MTFAEWDGGVRLRKAEQVSTKRVGAGIAMFLGLAAAALMVSLGSSGRPPSHSAISGSPAGVIQLSRKHGPLLAGGPVTLAEAEALAAEHLSRPQSTLANDSTILNVYYEKRSDDEGNASYIVAIDYESGLVVFIHPVSYDGAPFQDPAAQYGQMAGDLNAALRSSIASVVTIQGVPALAIQAAPGGVASVDLVLSNGLRVQLIAEYDPKMDLASVEDAANTLK
jgi:hypothetical protein